MSSSLELENAAKEGNIKALHMLLANDPKILNTIDNEAPFAHTPLHIAARHGMSEFAAEIATFKPSFTRKLNPDGLSPMHVALYSKQWQTVRALMLIDTELIRVKGSGGKTPLHVAAEVASKQLLAEFLFVCPSSILDVTSRWETAVHLAILKDNLDSFKVLFGWLTRVHRKYILNWKDINGDTALHLATKASSKPVVEMLVKYVSIHSRNFCGKTALDIHTDRSAAQDKTTDRNIKEIDEDMERILRGDRNGIIRKLAALPYRPVSLGKYYSTGLYATEKCLRFFGFRPIDTNGENKSQKSRDVVLLVAVLIGTAAYQAILTPPWGYWQDNNNITAGGGVNNSNATAGGGAGDESHYAGELIMNGPSLFNFVAFNSLAFCFSLAAIVTNIVELKQRVMLNSATLVLLLTYSCTLILNLNQGKESGWKWSDWLQFRLVAIIPSMVLIVGLCYIAIGSTVALSKFYERLTDNVQRNIHHLIGYDEEMHPIGPVRSINISSIFGSIKGYCVCHQQPAV